MKGECKLGTPPVASAAFGVTFCFTHYSGENSKPHDYRKKVQKEKDQTKTWVLTGKQFEDFRRKRTETLISTFQKNPVEHRDP